MVLNIHIKMVIMLSSIKYKEWVLLKNKFKNYHNHKNSIIKWYHLKQIKKYQKVSMEEYSKLKSSTGIASVLEIQLILHPISEMV